MPTKKREAAEPNIPPGCVTLLTREAICRAIGYSARSFDAMVSAGEYPGPDLMLNRFPRWRVETHNGWVEARCLAHKE